MQFIVGCILIGCLGQQAQPNFTMKLLLEMDEHDQTVHAAQIAHAVEQGLPASSPALQPTLLTRRAFALAVLGKTDDAVRELTKARDLKPNDSTIECTLARVYLQQGKLTDALDLVDTVISRDPHCSLAYTLKAVGFSQRGKDVDSLSLLHKALELDDSNVHAYLARASILLKQGDVQNSLRDLEIVVCIDPNASPETIFVLRGFALSRLQRYKQAISSYRLALRLNDDNKEARIGLGSVHLAMGQYETAIRITSEAFEKWPKDLRVAAIAIRALTLGKQFEQAEQVTKAVFHKSSRHSELFKDVALLCISKRDFKEANWLLRESVAIEPTNEGSLSALAMFRASCPDPEYRDGKESQRIATSLCQRSKWTNADHIVVLSMAYAENGDFHNAKALLSKARQLISGLLPETEIRIAELQGIQSVYDSNRPYRIACD